MVRILSSFQKNLSAIVPIFILCVIPPLTYLNTLHNDFVFDDLALIQGNETLSSSNSISSIINIITKKNVYRPVRTLSYAIDYHFSGLNPFSYHISNIIYHIITVFLIYLTTHFLLKNRVTAFLTALLFAVHPVHTESVAYISGRRDILFTLFS